MTEVLLAILVAVVLTFVTAATPAWLAKLAIAGGLAFIVYGIILVVKWFLGR